MDKPVTIGLAGGTGAGKTTFADAIIEAVGSENCLLISQDAYYIDHAEPASRSVPRSITTTRELSTPGCCVTTSTSSGRPVRFPVLPTTM